MVPAPVAEVKVLFECKFCDYNDTSRMAQNFHSKRKHAKQFNKTVASDDGVFHFCSVSDNVRSSIKKRETARKLYPAVLAWTKWAAKAAYNPAMPLLRKRRCYYDFCDEIIDLDHATQGNHDLIYHSFACLG